MRITKLQARALERSITPDRFATYLSVSGGDADHARAPYRWDRELAVAFLADIALLEVALRNAMNEQLTRRWGPGWYRDSTIPLDDRSAGQLATAWERVRYDRVPGRIIAQCMFGFWVGLLDKGDHSGRPPRRLRCRYEERLWRGVLDRAFIGGRARARADGLQWNRAYAHRVVSRVNALRNRVAHHEPLINGFPLNGQGERVTAEEGHEDCLRLAAMLDRHLHSLLRDTSRVPLLLRRRPRQRDVRVRGLRRGASRGPRTVRVARRS